MCRDRAEELVRKLEWTPYSRQLFDEWKREPRPEDDLEWAARWFFMQCSRFSASHHGGWAYNKAKLTVNVPCAPQFRRRLARILPVRDRLADVQIECADFRVMMERYGGYEENLLYIDPPYPGKAYYQFGFTEEDHRDLAELAHASKAKIALSSGDDPLTSELYGDWVRHQMQCVTQSAKSDRGDSKPRRTELLLTNYTAQEDFFYSKGVR